VAAGQCLEKRGLGWAMAMPQSAWPWLGLGSPLWPLCSVPLNFGLSRSRIPSYPILLGFDASASGLRRMF
jgi:hypothetical protein